MKFRLIICTLFVLTALAAATLAQSSTQISRRCSGASPSPARAKAEVEKDGDVSLVPCSGRSVFVNGVASSALITSLNGLTATSQTFAVPTAADTAAWSSATSIHTLSLPITAVTGSSRTNFFPNFSAANTFAKSPFSWNGTIYTWNNTALNGTFTMNLTPGIGGASGEFLVGGTAIGGASWYFDGVNNQGFITNDLVRVGKGFGGNGTYIEISDTGATPTIRLNPTTEPVSLTLSNGATPSIILRNAAGTNDLTFLPGTGTLTATLTQNVSLSTPVFSLAANTTTINLFRTITAAGTTGNQDIHKAAGTVNFAAGTSAITVTNNAVGVNSIIFAVARTNDATCSVKNVVPGITSFVINMTANCTAETSVGFFVTN